MPNDFPGLPQYSGAPTSYHGPTYGVSVDGGWFGDPKSREEFLAEIEVSEGNRKRLQQEQAAKSGAFGDYTDLGYQLLGNEAGRERDYLRQLARGQNSVSAEQLRQGLQQNVAAQRSLAAGASPQNSAMAARTASMQASRLGAGMSGQQALAGLQERNQAQMALQQAILQQRQQDLQGSLGSRQNAIQGYSTTPKPPEKSTFEKYGPAAIAAGAAIFSDERLKRDVRDGDTAADKAIAGLRAHTYRYKDQKHGAGSQLGVMAQALEGAGLAHTVEDTPAGKMVHGARLATSNTALIARLGARVAELEKRAR